MTSIIRLILIAPLLIPSRTAAEPDTEVAKITVLGIKPATYIPPGTTAASLPVAGDIPTPATRQLQRSGLVYLPGGPTHSNTRFSIRGFSPEHSLILYEGFEPPDPGMFLNPVHSSQMEIVKGSLTSLYGSQALSGVINATRAQPDGHKLTTGYGSFKTWHWGFATAPESWPIAMAARHWHTDGGYPTRDRRGLAVLPNSDLTKNDIWARFGNPKKTSLVIAAARRSGGNPGTAGRRYDHQRDTKNQIWIHGKALELNAGPDSLVNLGLGLGYLTTKHSDPQGEAWGVPYSGETRIGSTEVHAQAFFFGLDRFTIVTGLKSILSKEIDSSNQEWRNHLHTSWEWTPTRNGQLTVTPSIAVGHQNSKTSDQVEPAASLAMNLQLTDTLKLSAQIGRSYRFPSASQLWTKFGPVIGNPFLNPETSWGGDTALTFQNRSFEVSVGAFRYVTANLIQYWRTPGGFKPVNIGEGESRGLELASSWFGPWTSVTARLTGQIIFNRTPNDPNFGRILPHQPTWFGNLTVSQHIWPKVLNIESSAYVAVGRYDDPERTDPLPDHISWDMLASWHADPWTICLSLENILARLNVDHQSFPLGGRMISLLVRVNL